MATNTSCSHDIHEQDQDDYMPFPKPPSSDPPAFQAQPFAAELSAVTPSTDPPPPYPFGPRTSRRARASTTRSARRALHVSDDSGGEAETSPLLGGRHRRTGSHSSTVHSVQSLAHNVVISSRAIISLFQIDPDSSIVPLSSAVNVPLSTRVKRYFTPLIRRKYYAALFHLFFINFPFELVAWIYLFVGTLVSFSNHFVIL